MDTVRNNGLFHTSTLSHFHTRMRLNEHASETWVWKALGCAVVAVGGLYLIGWLMAGMFGPLRTLGQSIACQGNVVRMTRAFRMYADDYQDHFPPAEAWMDRTFFYVTEERKLHCPAV